MRSTLQFLALASVALASPQNIDFAAVDNAPKPTIKGPPVGASSQTIPLNVQAAAASASAAVDANPLPAAVVKRTLGVNDPCGVQPDGTLPKPTDDSVASFLAFPLYASTATSAVTPSGYQQAFTNLGGSVNGNVYLGLNTLTAYDPAQCAALCNAKDGCSGFNIFYERDPTLNPASPDCPNPTSFTNAKCTLWGAGVTSAMAVNTGQTREQFVVVIAGSNGYNKVTGPPAQPGFTGPVQLGGAIQAPKLKGVDTYLGVKFFATAYLPALCAAACQAQTAYDRRHARNGNYKPCNFFAAYIMSKNNQAQGLYCALYTAPWDASYGTNTGQTRGTDVYTISSAYSYTLDPQDSGKLDASVTSQSTGKDDDDKKKKDADKKKKDDDDKKKSSGDSN